MHVYYIFFGGLSRVLLWITSFFVDIFLQSMHALKKYFCVVLSVTVNILSLLSTERHFFVIISPLKI